MPYFIYLLIFLAVPLTCSAAEVPYSAIVMDVKGKVEVQRDRKKMPVDLGCLLYAGDKVETAKGASVTVHYLESGQEEQWPGKMKFTIDKLRSRPAISRHRPLWRQGRNGISRPLPGPTPPRPSASVEAKDGLRPGR